MEIIVIIAVVVFVIWLIARSQRTTAGSAAATSYQTRRIATPRQPKRNSAPPRRTMSADECWIPSGREVTVGRYTIPGGMVYVGEGLMSVAGHSIEPALIDPSRPVDRMKPARDGSSMTYWPSYGSIPPGCRAAYLDWLLVGRRDPSAYIGYVFLFFYGLERRALADASVSEQAKQEIPAIMREVEELLGVYGGNGSFRGYASRFLDVLKLAQVESGIAEPPMEPEGYELPLSTRIGIGRIVAAGKPLPADWALSWFLTHPETYLRTPAKRCAKEFRELFRARYAQAFGEGLVVKPNRSRLRLTIRPASASFGGEVSVSTELPDIAALTAPVSKLRRIAESCDADLDAFSRWVGRNPDSPRTIAAVALLPAELAKSQTSDEAGGLWAWIKKTLGPHDRVVCKTDDLLQHCASFGSGKLAKSEAVLLAQLLEKGGYGIEPDVRFGGSSLAPGGTAVIFKLPADAAPIASPQYAGATVLLHLAVAVSAADGSISPAEEKHLEEHMRESLTLSGGEQVRLSAHLSWLMQARPSLTQVRKRLEALDAQQRKTIAEFMIGVAGADGQISPEEIRTLGKIYPMLGFASDEVYSHVHAMAAGVGIEVEGVGEAGPSGGYSVPGRPGPSEPVRLDMAAVKKKVAESAQISAILDDIFTEDEQLQITAPQTASPLPAGKVPPMHGVFLSRLVERPEWSRADFERVASECKLLPDGAIDALNEAAFERAGVPLIEGDDPMYIDSATAKELLA